MHTENFHFTFTFILPISVSIFSFVEIHAMIPGIRSTTPWPTTVGQMFWFLDCLILEMRPVWPFETLGTVYPVTQHNILEELDFQRGQRENKLTSLFNTHFIYLWLCNNAISNSDYLELNCRVVAEFYLLFCNYPGGTEKPMSSLSQHTLYSSQDLNRISSKLNQKHYCMS